MLEIVLLYFLCKSIGNVLRDKGRKPLGFQILLVIMWFGGEFLGGAVAGLVHAIRHGAAPMELDLSVYLFAIVAKYRRASRQRSPGPSYTIPIDRR